MKRRLCSSVVMPSSLHFVANTHIKFLCNCSIPFKCEINLPYTLFTFKQQSPVNKYISGSFMFVPSQFVSVCMILHAIITRIALKRLLLPFKNIYRTKNLSTYLTVQWNEWKETILYGNPFIFIMSFGLKFYPLLLL